MVCQVYFPTILISKRCLYIVLKLSECLSYCLVHRSPLILRSQKDGLHLSTPNSDFPSKSLSDYPAFPKKIESILSDSVIVLSRRGFGLTHRKHRGMSHENRRCIKMFDTRGHIGQHSRKLFC